MIECWYKAKKCQICSTNTKRFLGDNELSNFWGNEGNIGTFQKPFPSTGVA